MNTGIADRNTGRGTTLLVEILFLYNVTIKRKSLQITLCNNQNTCTKGYNEMLGQLLTCMDVKLGRIARIGIGYLFQ